MSPLATNERPLSCTCLPKLLTDIDELQTVYSANESQTHQLDDEFFDIQTNILSTSDPLPRGNFFEQNGTQTYSRNFIERLNDYQNYRNRKTITPKIVINDEYLQTNKMNALSLSIDTNQLDVSANNNNIPKELVKSDEIKSPQIPSTSQSNISVSVPVTVTSDHACSTSINSINAINTNANITSINCITSMTVTPIICTSTNIINPTIPHPNIVQIHNSDATQSSTTSTTRRQRHSIAGQMGFFKIMDIAGGFSRKMATSTNSLFSTAVISGSSSAPNLRDMIPNTASPSGTESKNNNK